MKQTLKLDLNYIRQWAEYRAPFMTGKFNTLNLMTALQPIYSLAHKRVVGHEALVRIQDKGGAPVSPAILFDQERSATEVIHLDRLCRFIHLHNLLPAHQHVHSETTASWRISKANRIAAKQISGNVSEHTEHCLSELYPCSKREAPWIEPAGTCCQLSKLFAANSSIPKGYRSVRLW